MKLKEDKKFYFDEKAADRVVYFIETHIRHLKGELGGQLFKLEPFQKTIVRDYSYKCYSFVHDSS